MQDYNVEVKASMVSKVLPGGHLRTSASSNGPQMARGTLSGPPSSILKGSTSGLQVIDVNGHFPIFWDNSLLQINNFLKI